MLLNSGVGEHSWESLGLQGDPASESQRKSVLNIHWKDWCWSWNSNTLATWCKEVTHLKRLWCWERLKVGGEGRQRMRLLDGMTDWMDMSLGILQELVMEEAWHAAIHGVTKSGTRLSNWTELNWVPSWRGPCSWLHPDLDLPNAPSPNTFTLGIKPSAYEFGKDTNIQSIKDTFFHQSPNRGQRIYFLNDEFVLVFKKKNRQFPRGKYHISWKNQSVFVDPNTCSLTNYVGLWSSHFTFLFWKGKEIE